MQKDLWPDLGEDLGESSRVIVMAMADDDLFDLLPIHFQGPGVMKDRQALPRVKKNCLAPTFEQERKAMLSQMAPGGGRIFHQDFDAQHE